MACCALIAMLLALICRLVWRGRRADPLAWRPAISSSIAPRQAAGLWRSLGHAASGLRFLIANEPNARIHLCAAVLALTAGTALRVGGEDWRWLILAMVLVLAAEALNTAVEQLGNAVSLQHHHAIGAAKDVAAGAVLLCAAGAALIGVLTLGPYLWAAVKGERLPLPAICGEFF